MVKVGNKANPFPGRVNAFVTRFSPRVSTQSSCNTSILEILMNLHLHNLRESANVIYRLFSPDIYFVTMYKNIWNPSEGLKDNFLFCVSMEYYNLNVVGQLI